MQCRCSDLDINIMFLSFVVMSCGLCYQHRPFFETVALLFLLELMHVFIHIDLSIFGAIFYTDYCVILKMSLSHSVLCLLL